MKDYRQIISELSDEELRKVRDVAVLDLQLAAQNEPETEWHEACFSAVLLYTAEMSQRGLKESTVH